MAVDNETIQRLTEEGRRHGNRLSIEQLGRAVPIETMTPEEVAVVVERLEAAGIDVDLDDERLKRPRGARSYDSVRGEGVVDLASPAAPAVSVPGVKPSVHGWEDDALGHAHGSGAHGTRKAPTWNRNGVDMLPIVIIVVVALVMIAIVGG